MEEIKSDTEPKVKKIGIGIKILIGTGILLLIFVAIGGLAGLQGKKVYAEALKLQPLAEKAQNNFSLLRIWPD